MKFDRARAMSRYIKDPIVFGIRARNEIMNLFHRLRKEDEEAYIFMYKAQLFDPLFVKR